jgi:hypothetical protein
MLWISWVVEQLLSSQQGFVSMLLVKGESKVISRHEHVWGSGGIVSLFLTSAEDGGGGQLHVPAALPSLKQPNLT